MEYELEEIPVSLAAHPTKDLVSVGCVDGSVHLLCIKSRSDDDIEEGTPSEKDNESLANPLSVSSLVNEIKYIQYRISFYKIRTDHCQSSVAGVSTESEYQVQLQWSKLHKSPVRKVLFAPGGHLMYSVTRNRTVCCFDVETCQKIRVVRNITEKRARPYCAATVGDEQLVVGDEFGSLTVLDWRSSGSASSPICGRVGPSIANDSSDNENNGNVNDGGARYLTDVLAGERAPGRRGLALVGRADGVLLVADLRKSAYVQRSETMHDELSCLSAMKHGKKLLCGSADGHIEVFNWSEWGNIVERLDTGHTESVECMCPLDEDILATGSSDGTVRLYSVLPNRRLGVVAGKVGAAPVEALALCPAGNWLVSADQDAMIRFFDATKLLESAPKTRSGSEMKKLTKNANISQNADFLADLLPQDASGDEENEESDSDDDDDDDDEDSEQKADDDDSDDDSD